jgi:heparanase 1
VPRIIRTTIQQQQQAPAAALAAAAASATVSVDARGALARSDATRFASFSFDFTALFGVQRTAIPFADARLRQYARNLAPAFVRFGGSFQDRAVSAFAGVPQPPAPPPSMLVLALNESVFDGLVDFASATGLDLVYGLNAAVGRQTAAGGPAPWAAENALAPVARAAARGYRLPVVELGNEVNVFNCSKDGSAKMSPAQLAAQYAEAAAAVRALLPGTRVWGSDSSITGDFEGQCHDYYGEDIFGFNRDLFAQPGWAGLLDGYSWHYYSQDSRNGTSTAALILSDEYQARLLNADAKARALRDAAAPGLPILLGETASFWAGGRANVSNRFASGFFYLPQLASLAARGYLTHIRQDLAGGDYGMLDLVLDAAGVVVDFS